MAVVFDPMRSNRIPWQTKLLKSFWTENDVSLISSWDLLREVDFGYSPLKWIGKDGHPTARLNQLILDEMIIELHRK